MKNNIVFKFIAVFLCAASLLGAAASGIGIFAMTEVGLYDRRFDEVYAEHLKNNWENLANEAAVRYASMELGGCSSQLTDSYYGTHWYDGYFDGSRIGYVLRDSEGNVLQEQTMDEGLSVEYSFEFPVSGSYVNVLSEMTQEEYDALYAPPETEPQDGEYTVYNIVPAEGAEVTCIEMDCVDSGAWIIDVGETLGVLFYGDGNSMEFQSVMDFGGLGTDPVLDTTRNIRFLNEEEGLLYEASRPEGVVRDYSYIGGETWMRLWPMDGTAAAPELVLYDAIPPEGMYVSRVHVTYADGFEESAWKPDIGFLGYDEDGRVEFTANSDGILEARENVKYISFWDENGTLIYEASDPDRVGSFYLEGGKLIFRADITEEDGGVEATISTEADTYLYDDVPPQGEAVYRVELWLKGGSEMYTVSDMVEGDGSATAIGKVSHDGNGNVTLICNDWKDFVFSKPAKVVYICLTDYDGRVLYEAYTDGVEIGSGEVVGTFAYDENDKLVFASIGAEVDMVADAVTRETIALKEPDTNEGIAAVSEEDPVETTKAANDPAEETVPEPTMETVDPTEETVPETTEMVTVPQETVSGEMAATEATAAPEAFEATEAAEDTDEVSEEPTWAAYTAETVAAENAQIYGYYNHSTGEHMIVEYTYEDMPAYTMEVQMASGALAYEYGWILLELVYDLQEYLLPVLGISLLLFAVMAVYLCCAAGRKPGTAEVHAGGLNCISLDLYCGIAVLGVMVIGILGVEGTQYLLRSNTNVALLFALLMAFAACLMIVGFCFACAAQFKTPGGYWWRNSLCARSVDLLGLALGWLLKLCVWMANVCKKKLWPLVARGAKALWKIAVFFWQLAGRGLSWLLQQLRMAGDRLWRKLTRFFALLPVTWQWLLVGFVMFLLMAMVYATNGEEVLIVLCIGACIAIIIYGAHCFGTLLEAAKRMSKGDLDEKVDDKLLVGSFKDFAGELNSLADVAVIAAQKQLKSERMKTELITNVSHDIKTPLTSIINYVDLLQKPHSEEEQEVYLEVLDRQSQRLKKLIEDLMEMSKASTGNLAVDIGKVDAAEAINQALGEFADKLDKAQLTPVFRQPDDPIEMMADGRLVWRVMSNLLGNAVKYALPGTRLYVDLMAVDGKVIISMKNISREELNVNADELLERFVRGDASRNTEGSGLGLNIAQSLMELQKGQLQLLVDGDLFKVTLIFPGT